MKCFKQLSKIYEGKERLKVAPFIEEVKFGNNGELAMRWYSFRNGKKPTAKLEVYPDGFSALAENKDLLEALAKTRDIQPDEFCELLKKYNFVEKTD